jgi:hypothetical protein
LEEGADLWGWHVVYANLLMDIRRGHKEAMGKEMMGLMSEGLCSLSLV